MSFRKADAAEFHPDLSHPSMLVPLDVSDNCKDAKRTIKNPNAMYTVAL
jgi:hypothetical protein